LPAQEERTIMKHGSSGVVAIPMAYRRYHNLKHGDKVKVVYDNLILIIPEGMEDILQEKKELINQLLQS